MSTSNRSEHLEKIIKRLISDVIYKKVNDPRIKFVTITKIILSSNLASAKIYITIFNDKENVRKCLKALRNATSFIRHEISKDLELRRSPEIEFLVDREMLHQYKILEITRKIKEERNKSNETHNNEE
jgi:ribosome-binding factor A